MCALKSKKLYITNYDNEIGDDDMACQVYFKSLEVNVRYRISDVKFQKGDTLPWNVMHRF